MLSTVFHQNARLPDFPQKKRFAFSGERQGLRLNNFTRIKQILTIHIHSREWNRHMRLGKMHSRHKQRKPKGTPTLSTSDMGLEASRTSLHLRSKHLVLISSLSLSLPTSLFQLFTFCLFSFLLKTSPFPLFLLPHPPTANC